MPNVYVAPPGWGWDIVLYFFFGGLAGGCYFFASMLRLVGTGADARISRIGYYLAFPLVNVCALLLIKDLGVPERFWHMLIRSEQVPLPIFKWWSPISFGSWIVAASGILPLVSFVHALLEGGILRNRSAQRITHTLHDGTAPAGKVFLVFACLLGLVLAGYTGILLNVNNAPTWSHDPLLPALFMASGVATAGAVLYLISWAADAGTEFTRQRVLRTAGLALAFEAALLLVSVVLAFGSVSPVFMGGWAVLFWALLVPFGVIAPLMLLFNAFQRRRDLVKNALPLAAALIMGGGLLFRLLEVFGGQAYFVPY